jgi:hypothetical protein
MNDPLERRPIASRSTADLTSVILELSRLVQALTFYDASRPERSQILDRTCLALRADFERSGLLELHLDGDAFFEQSADRAVRATPLAKLARTMQRHAVCGMRFQVNFGRDALEEFAAFLAGENSSSASQAEIDQWGKLGVELLARRPAAELAADVAPPQDTASEVSITATASAAAAVAVHASRAAVDERGDSTESRPEAAAGEAAAIAPPAGQPELSRDIARGEPDLDRKLHGDELPEEDLLNFESELLDAAPLSSSGAALSDSPDPRDELAVPEPPDEWAVPVADGHKPSLEEHPMDAPGDPRGQRLCGELRSLYACRSDYDAYRHRTAATLEQARSLITKGALEEAYRAALVLCRHAGCESEPRPEYASWAQQALVELCQRELLVYTIERACSDTDRVGVHAARVLVQVGAPAIGPILAQLRRSSDRDGAAQLAAVVVAVGEPAIEALCSDLESPSGLPSRMSLQLAGELQSPLLVASLAPWIHSENGALRRDACRALSAIGGAAHEAFVDALDSSVSEVARSAASSLGRMGNSRAARPLLHALSVAIRRGDERFARDALAALGRLGEPRTVPAMAELAEQRDWLRFGERARERDATRCAAIAAIQCVGGKVAAIALRRLAEHRDSEIAAAAQAALAALDVRNAPNESDPPADG